MKPVTVFGSIAILTGLLRVLSEKDYLTGLYNRRYMQETLEKEIIKAIKQKRSLGIIMLDIDDFTKINDTFGHALGDAVLCEAAELLGAGIRKSDAACRFGGDEFVLILPESSLIQTKEGAKTLRENIRNRVFRYGQTDDGSITLSYGIAAAPENGLSGEALLKYADNALYNDKEASGNTVNEL